MSIPSLTTSQTTPSSPTGRDSLLNGTMIGLAAGAGLGMAVTYRYTDAHDRQDYLASALYFGSFGAALGLGVDALLQRDSRVVERSPHQVSFGLVVSPSTTRVGVLTQ